MADQYKFSILNRTTGECHEGRTWDSIARRVWGRKAEVRSGEKITGTDNLFGQIVRPIPGEPQTFNVLATVFLKRHKK